MSETDAAASDGAFAAEVDGCFRVVQWWAHLRALGNTAAQDGLRRALSAPVSDGVLDRIAERQAADPWWTWLRILDRVKTYPRMESLRRRFLSGTLASDLGHILAPAPVVELDGRFVLNAKPKPRKSDWRWIIAVRQGAATPADGLGDSLAWRAAKFPPGPSRESLFGQDILDLVACDADLARVTSRFLGATAVVGWPVEPTHAAEPVRVFETPMAWLLARGAGVFLCGDDFEQATWLRACDAGIRTASVPLGLALQKKMQRPVVALPKVLVDA